MSADGIRRRGILAVLAAATLASLFVAGTVVAPHVSDGPGRLLAWAYAPLCHQIAERSIPSGPGVQAVCARCFGLYLGGAAALWLAAGCMGWLTPRLRPWALGLAFTPTLVDVLLPWLGFAGLPNLPRLLLALPAGFVAGLFLAVGIGDLFGRTRKEQASHTTSVPGVGRRTTLEVFDG